MRRMGVIRPPETLRPAPSPSLDCRINLRVTICPEAQVPDLREWHGFCWTDDDVEKNRTTLRYQDPVRGVPYHLRARRRRDGAWHGLSRPVFGHRRQIAPRRLLGFGVSSRRQDF